MKQRCLLIKTNNIKFLTHEKNLNSIIEYAKTFKSKIELVEVKKGTKILDLKNFSIAICDPNYEFNDEYKKIKDIYPSKRIESTKSKNIRDFIKNNFLSGKKVSIKNIKEKYKKEKINDSSIYNHISYVKKQLASEGYKLEKISTGTYFLSVKK
jgi:hypothetical protein